MIQNPIFPYTQFDPSGKFHVTHWGGVLSKLGAQLQRGARLEANITPIQDASAAKAGVGESVI